MKGVNLFRIVLAVAGLVLLLLLIRSYADPNLFAELTNLNFVPLFVYFVFGVLIRLLCGLRWYWISKTLGSLLALTPYVAARLAGDAVGILLPSGRMMGDPLRVGLAYRGGIKVEDATASVALDRVAEVIGNAFAVVAYSTFFVLSQSAAMRGSLAVLSITMLSLVILLLFPIYRLYRGQKALAPLYSRMASFESLKRVASLVERAEMRITDSLQKDPKLFFLSVVMAIAIEAVVIVEYYFLFLAFGVEMPLAILLLVILSGGVARAVPTPGGLGILEGSQVALFGLLQSNPALGLKVGIILRLHDLLWITLGTLAFFLRSVWMPPARVAQSA